MKKWKIKPLNVMTISGTSKGCQLLAKVTPYISIRVFLIGTVPPCNSELVCLSCLPLLNHFAVQDSSLVKRLSYAEYVLTIGM